MVLRVVGFALTISFDLHSKVVDVFLCMWILALLAQTLISSLFVFYSPNAHQICVPYFSFLAFQNGSTDCVYHA